MNESHAMQALMNDASNQQEARRQLLAAFSALVAIAAGAWSVVAYAIAVAVDRCDTCTGPRTHWFDNPDSFLWNVEVAIALVGFIAAVLSLISFVRAKSRAGVIALGAAFGLFIIWFFLMQFWRWL